MLNPIKRQDTSLPMQYRDLPVATVNAAARTVEVIFSTGATVRRLRWEGGLVPYDEILLISEAAINMQRLNAGAPVLDSHEAYSTAALVAVVDKAWVEGTNAMARLRFPTAGTDEAADRMWSLVVEGIIRNVSVGYSQDEIRIIEAQAGKIEQRIVTRWTPYEISFVTIPADPGAQTRGQPRMMDQTRSDGGVRTFPAVLIEDLNMNDVELNAAGQAETIAAVTESVETTAAISTRAAEAERRRTLEINSLCRQHGMAAEFADEHIRLGTSTTDLGRRILDQLAQRARETDTVSLRITADVVDKHREAVENAVLHRANPQATRLTDAGRQWRGMSLIEMGRAHVEETRGVRLRGLGKNELAGVLLGMDTRSGMLSTSDFGILLANVASKRLRDGYGAARQTWRAFSRQNNASDFKERAIVMLQGLPEFRKVAESGEYQYARLSDSVERYALATYGRIIALTRQTLINDDLGAFDKIPMILGRAAAEFESDTVWNALLKNPVMGDGKTLFHADHGNQATTGGDPSEATLTAADIAMGAQLDAAGKPLNIQARFLAVSRKHAVAARKIMGAVAATKSGDINVYQNSMEIITEDRLYNPSGPSPWFTIADPGQWDTLEYAYLDGQEGLYTEQRVGFEVDGIEIKGRLDFAAKAIDWKGFQKNPGN